MLRIAKLNESLFPFLSSRSPSPSLSLNPASSNNFLAFSTSFLAAVAFSFTNLPTAAGYIPDPVGVKRNPLKIFSLIWSRSTAYRNA